MTAQIRQGHAKCDKKGLKLGFLKSQRQLRRVKFKAHLEDFRWASGVSGNP